MLHGEHVIVSGLHGQICFCLLLSQELELDKAKQAPFKKKFSTWNTFDDPRALPHIVFIHIQVLLELNIREIVLTLEQLLIRLASA